MKFNLVIYKLQKEKKIFSNSVKKNPFYYLVQFKSYVTQLKNSVLQAVSKIAKYNSYNFEGNNNIIIQWKGGNI